MKRQVRVKFAGVIFISLLFVLVISLVETRNLDLPGSMIPPNLDSVESVAVEKPIDTPGEADCTQIESEFAVKLDQSRSCAVDADCALARLECPFECTTSVSTSVHDELMREEMFFQKMCHRCESSCPDTLTKWRAACIRQRCIVLDRSLEELEDETLRLLNESG